LGVSVDLPLPATLPTDYIPGRELRLRLYRRLAEIKDEPALAEVRAELAERFGPPPEAVDNLLFLMQIKLLAYRAGVEAVASEAGQIVLRSRVWETDAGRAQAGLALDARARIGKGRVWLPRAGAMQWRAELVGALEALGRAV
jgi:transcription-repair coupling factor (superfamily II helicase)